MACRGHTCPKCGQKWRYPRSPLNCDNVPTLCKQCGDYSGAFSMMTAYGYEAEDDFLEYVNQVRKANGINK